MNILDVIRQSAHQHKILKIIYIELDGSNEGWRDTEPYSLKGIGSEQALFAWDIQKDGIRRFILDRIRQAELTDSTFIARYPIEI